MVRIVWLLLAFLVLVGCRTRKEMKSEHHHKVQKERFIHYKDSALVLSQRLQQLDFLAFQDWSVEIESGKDSVGNAQEVTYYRIRDGDNETIRVSGGKVKITTKSSLSNSLIEANSTLSNTIIDRKDERRDMSTDTTFLHKTKEVKGIVIRWWWIAVVLLSVWIGWRYKVFRF